MLVTQDADFYDMSLLAGTPPKVIWIHAGNTSTGSLEKLLKKSEEAILVFDKNKDAGCLELY